MSINAYTGLQGSGKSFEVVSSVIVPGIARGRRVITNIDGINQEKIHEYLIAKNKSTNPSKLGSVIHVTNERILQAAFFFDETKPDIDVIVKPGDIVAIDEAWRFWPADGGKLSLEHMQFFRMHRHYTHPDTGVSCDVALMIQDISGLHRSVKNVVEFSFRTTKHKKLGFASHYRIEIFEGYKQLRTNAISQLQKKYDPKIFPLYKSYSGSNGNESAIDGRINVFKRWWLPFVVPGVVLLFWWGSSNLNRFFKPETHTKKPAIATSSSPNSSGSLTAVTTEKTSTAPSFSSQWRIVGSTSFADQQFVVLAGPTGRIRYEHPSNFMNTGISMVGKVDGETVSYYSGTLPPPVMTQAPIGAPR